MGKGMRLGHLTGALLQVIIADHPRRIQRLLEVAGLQQPVHRPRPDPRKAIRLKLKPHGQRIGLRLAHGLTAAVDLGQDAKLVLDVMRHFVSDHIGRREIALGAKLTRQRVEKLSIEIGLAIRRAIKRARRAGCPATGALGHTGIKHHHRRAILAAQLLGEHLAPDGLGGGKNPR